MKNILKRFFKKKEDERTCDEEIEEILLRMEDDWCIPEHIIKSMEDNTRNVLEYYDYTTICVDIRSIFEEDSSNMRRFLGFTMKSLSYREGGGCPHHFELYYSGYKVYDTRYVEKYKEYLPMVNYLFKHVCKYVAEIRELRVNRRVRSQELIELRKKEKIDDVIAELKKHKC